MPPLATRSGIAQNSTPIENVIALPSSAPAAPRPARSSSTAASSGNVNQIVCVRMPTASPAISAPATINRPDSAIAAASALSARRRRTNADARHACAASAMPSPGTSLSGRSAVNQNSGDATTTSVASAARRSRSASIAVRSIASMLLNSAMSENTDSAPNNAPQNDNEPDSDGHTACDNLPSAMKRG